MRRPIAHLAGSSDLRRDRGGLVGVLGQVQPEVQPASVIEARAGVVGERAVSYAKP
jgi:hypothetical protein